MTNEDPIMDEEEAGEAVARYLEENPQLLEGIVPAHDLWPAIESRISARVIPISVAPTTRAARRSMGWLPMLIAASALIASTAGVTYVLTTRSASHGTANGSVATTLTPAPVAHTDSQRAKQVVEPEGVVASGNVPREGRDSPSTGTHHGNARRATTQLASRPSAAGNDVMRRTYDSEMETLHAALEARRSQLSPSTVEIIEQNLRVIDDAIRQSKEALAKDPNSRLLNDQLDRTLAKKTGLLRAAALLPAA